MKASMQPTEQWGPANPIHRIGKYSRPSDNSNNRSSDASSETFAVDQSANVGNYTDSEVTKTGMTSRDTEVTPPPRYERKTASVNDAFEEDKMDSGNDYRLESVNPKNDEVRF